MRSFTNYCRESLHQISSTIHTTAWELVAGLLLCTHTTNCSPPPAFPSLLPFLPSKGLVGVSAQPTPNGRVTPPTTKLVYGTFVSTIDALMVFLDSNRGGMSLLHRAFVDGGGSRARSLGTLLCVSSIKKYYRQ